MNVTTEFEFKKLMLEAKGWSFEIQLDDTLDRVEFKYSARLEYNDSGLVKQIDEIKEQIRLRKENPQRSLINEDEDAIADLEEDITSIRSQIAEAKITYPELEFECVTRESKNVSGTKLVFSINTETAIWIAQKFEDITAYRIVLEPFEGDDK